MQSVGDWSKNVDSLSSTDRWSDRTNECQYGTVSPRICNHQQDNWVKWLPLAELAAKNAVSEATQCTAFYVVQGLDPPMSFVGEPTRERDERQINANEDQAMMQQIHDHLRVEMRQSQVVQEEGANHRRIPPPNIQEGSQVWMDAWHIRTTRPTRKIDWKRLWPVTVVRRISTYGYEVEWPASIWIHRVQPVFLLHALVNDPLEGQRVNPPPPIEVDGEEEYQVSSVEDSRIYRN